MDQSKEISRRSFITGASALGLAGAGVLAGSAFAADAPAGSASASASKSGSAASGSAASASGSASGSAASGSAASASGSAASGSAASASGSAASSAASTDEIPAWLGAEPQIADSDIVETVDCDVCVCGGGNAGLFAACSAVENGAKTVLLEQFAENSGHGIRDDLGVYNSDAQQAAGATIDIALLARWFQMHTSWYQNEQLFKVWIDESAETMNWYADRVKEGGYDMKVQLVNPPADQEVSFSTAVDVDWGDVALTPGSTTNNGQYIINPYAEKQGVDCRWETKLVKCTKEDGRVTGVIAQNSDGGYIKVNAAKGVILCCGGYLNNDDMVNALQPNAKKVIVYNSTWPETNGDGIKAGLWAGAMMDPCHAISTWEQGLIAPDKTVAESHDTFETHWIGPLPFLRVNLNGERFMNESSSFDSLGHALLYQPGNTAVQVWDSSWQDDAKQFNVYGAHRYFNYDNDVAPLFTIDTVLEAMQPQIDSGLIVQADTIEELADKIGVPADNLAATVKRYNELTAAGEDTDYGKPGYRLSAIDTPPYYAARFAEQGSHTMDGLMIDADMRVLDPDLNPIPGLYAAGDNAGSHLGVTYMGNAAGNAAGRSITYGRHAGRVAALSTTDGTAATSGSASGSASSSAAKSASTSVAGSASGSASGSAAKSASGSSAK